MAIPKDNRFITPVSVSMRFFRREKIWRFGGALGLGCGFGISVNKEPRVYTFGIQVESFDTVDITFGEAFWIDSDSGSKDFKHSRYTGITFDIRFFKKLVDTVASGLTFK